MPGNAKGSRHRSPTANPITDAASVPRCRDVVESLRVALVSVAERLEDGAIDEAHELCLAALDDGPVIPSRVSLHCPECTLAIRWAGELEHHLAAVHQLTWDEIDLVVARAA